MTRARQLWLQVHRWVGLAAGVLLVVVGLSGSFLTFYGPIDRALNPDWTLPRSVGPAAQMQRVLDAARQSMPDRFLHSVFPPLDERDVHHVWFTPSADDQSAMWEVLVDPVSAQVLGQRRAVPTLEFTRRNLGNTVYTLHYSLFAGELGSTVVGFVGLFLLVSGATGLVLWWPRRAASFKTGLIVRRGSHGVRLHFDLHRVGGIYSVLLLSVVAFTGVVITFPNCVQPLVQALSPVRDLPTWNLTEVEGQPPRRTLTPASDPRAAAPLDADAALARAQALAPGAVLRCLWLPGASGPAWRLSLREPQGVAWAGGPQELWLHPQDGALLEQRPYAQASAGEVFIAWQLPLHGGSAFGLAGRVVVCALGFVPLLLMVTGTVIWWRKRRGRLAARRAQRRALAQRSTTASGAQPTDSC